MNKPLLRAALAAYMLCAPSALGQVTSGATEVTTPGMEKPVVEVAEIKDSTEMAVQAGALVSGGNARSVAGTAAARYLVRRNVHEATGAFAFNFARSATPDEAGSTERADMETTVENYQSRLRYDYYIAKKFSAFLAWQMRRDRFQGLNLRMGIDPGVAYHFVRDDRTKFWGEGGYDFQYEIRTQAVLDQAELDGVAVDEYNVDHNARFFLGYDQRLDSRLHLLAGLEYFKSLINEDAWRLNWDASLKLNLIDSFALAIGTLTQYNNAPLPGVRKLDVTSSLSFVYTIL